MRKEERKRRVWGDALSFISNFSLLISNWFWFIGIK